ncbi:MAG: hypothetical protein H0U84_09240 [Thermoleophilaceae bacterium]|nr:hypothetical protein [Thermoleophilaceae bacterium]
MGGYEQRYIRDFAVQSGKHPAVFGYFITWSAKKSALHWLGFRLSDATEQRSRVMLNVQPPAGLSPGAIARGKGDDFLVAMTRLLSEQGQVTYMRLLSEMNNGVNPYSPYDLAGRSRGPAYSTRAFKAAWRRAAIILRGGEVRSINRRLRRLGQPPARTGAGTLPSPQVALVWVPLSFGNPEVERNHPRHFWPGGGYVDWVGTTWYSKHPNSSAMDRFYDHPKWRRKPFTFAEWGVWGAESPGFIGNFFGFVRSHPRVRMAIYYQSANLKADFRLSTHPRSRAALRHATGWARLTGLAPEFGG